MHRSVPYAQTGPNHYNIHDTRDKAFKLFQEQGLIDTSYLENHLEYALVRPRLDTMMKSITKCDVPPCSPTTPSFFHALDLAWEYLEEDLTVLVDTDFQMDINMPSAPGVTYTLNGYRTKEDAIKSRIFEEKMKMNTTPMSSYNHKMEYLHVKDDLARDKLRTTACVEVDFNIKTKLFCDKQNSNLVKSSEKKWIKYGMCKQYGGFDEFLKSLEPYSHIIEADISGYDRCAYLYWVYYLRWRGMKYHCDLDELLRYVLFYNIYPTIVMPDGYIFLRATGNNSGGNNTASDNSILHLIIKFHLLCWRFFRSFSRFPTLSEILDSSLVGIYSDDKLAGINLDDFGWESIQEYKDDERYIYQQHGMIIKESAHLVTYKGKGNKIPEDHSFLGSYARFDEISNMYVPYPRIGKVCSSAYGISVDGELDEAEEFLKILSLCVLSVQDTELFNILISYAQYFFNSSKNKAFLERVMVSNGYGFEGKTSFYNLWTGREQVSLSNRAPFIFFLGVPTEV